MAHTFTNKIIQFHWRLSLEGTSNTFFFLALTAANNDKNIKFNNELKRSLGMDLEIENFYDYKYRFGVYDRIYEFVIISLCSDIEYLLKDLLPKIIPEKPFNFGFFQRLDEVFKEFKNINFDFSNCKDEINDLKLAFQIRHICIHNMGYVDEGFLKKTKLNILVGSKFKISNELFLKIRNSYEFFLNCLDKKITNL
tara:strand:+ start:363 stop:950 length:588 start_codon:yes stop_codon:yes gene_type:complete